MRLPYPERQIAVIGDVHAEDELLKLALTKLHDLGVQQLLCVGDIVDGPGMSTPGEVCAFLAAEVCTHCDVSLAG
jgi:predicted phosphodiesterase